MRYSFMLLLALVLAGPSGVRAQNDGSDDIDRLSLSVVTPTTYEGLNSSHLAALRGKIQRMVTHHGLSTDGFDANLVIYPTVDVYEREPVEGLRTLTIVRGELNLYVKHLGQNLVFSSFSLPIQGSGPSEAKAFSDAIRSLRPDAPSVQDFLNQAKIRILAYYAASCDEIIGTAETLAVGLRYDQALGALMMVPSAAATCHARTRQKAVELYRNRSRHCGQLVQKARGAMVQQNYATAVEYLANVDPTSSCHREAIEVMEAMQDRVDEQERRYYERVQEAYRAAVEIEKEHLRAARAIALAYYRSRPRAVAYQAVVVHMNR